MSKFTIYPALLVPISSNQVFAPPYTLFPLRRIPLKTTGKTNFDYITVIAFKLFFNSFPLALRSYPITEA